MQAYIVDVCYLGFVTQRVKNGANRYLTYLVSYKLFHTTVLYIVYYRHFVNVLNYSETHGNNKVIAGAVSPLD